MTILLKISLGLKREKAKCSGTPLSLALRRQRQADLMSLRPSWSISELQGSQDSVERHCQERKERKGEKEGRREGRGGREERMKRKRAREKGYDSNEK